ncbi:MAG: minor capsid protein [Planctomycetaceae bacterium]|jgi:hypothetical protein|nr:minor capsid protein [Planctomycetaceae bacterium]
MITLAQVVRRILLDLHISQPESVKDWFTTVAYLPDSPQAKDNIITVTDTEGNKDGRIMYSGETIIHPGCQIRTRATTYLTAYQKIKEIQIAMDKVHNYMTQIDNTMAYLQTISQQGGIMPMGLDSSGRRFHFSINYIATIRYVETSPSQ